MSYPFVPMPTLLEFIARAVQKFGAEQQEIQAPFFGPQGPGQDQIKGLLRRLPSGKILVAVLPEIDDNQTLTPTVLRSLCALLEIPPSEFGLDIEDQISD